jgi:hypothetical protein
MSLLLNSLSFELSLVNDFSFDIDGQFNALEYEAFKLYSSVIVECSLASITQYFIINLCPKTAFGSINSSNNATLIDFFMSTSAL